MTLVEFAKAKRLRRAALRLSRPFTAYPVRDTVRKETVGMSRQLRRHLCREEAWQRWCITDESAPRDDSGVITRRRRRSIAMAIAKQAFRKMKQ